MKTKKEILGTVFIAVGVVLIGLCLTLVLYNFIEDRNAQTASLQQLESVQSAIDARVEGSGPDDAVPADQQDIDSGMSVVFIDGYGYIGYLSFPSLDLALPVMDQGDETRLKLAPCRYHGSLETDDLVIAGHNYRSGFRQLRDINIGDEVRLTDMDGLVHTYSVAEVEVLNQTDVEKMVASGWDLSLYTCTYDGTQRFTVRCSKN